MKVKNKCPTAVVSTQGCVSDTPGEKETMPSLPRDFGVLGRARNLKV